MGSVSPHSQRVQPRRAFGDPSGNVTWHREGTALLTEGSQVPGEPWPRQLSGLARSTTPGGGQDGPGQRRSDAGLAGRGGCSAGSRRARGSSARPGARGPAPVHPGEGPREGRRLGPPPALQSASAAAAGGKPEAPSRSGETSSAGPAERSEKGGRGGRASGRGAG